jgi:hypothetical protein
MRGLPIGVLSQLLNRPQPEVQPSPRVRSLSQMGGAQAIPLRDVPQMPSMRVPPNVDPGTHYQRILEKLKMKNKHQQHMNTAFEHVIAARAAMFPKAKEGGKG